MRDVNAAIKNYEMAYAYVTITNEHGPSKQLLAFVNYDELSNDTGIGLESFDVDTTHEQILDQIANSDYLEIACESFTGRLKSIGEKVKNALTFNRHDNLNDLASGSLEPRKSSIYVVPAVHVERTIGYIKEAFKTLDTLLPKVPQGSSPEAWEAFYKTHSVEVSKAIAILERNHQMYSELGKQGEFDKSGWTVENFKQAIKSLGEIQTKFSHYQIKIDAVCKDLRETIALVHASNATVEQDDRDRQHDVVDSIENSHKKDDDPTKKHWVEDVAEKSVNEINRQHRAHQHNLLMKMVPAHVIKAMNLVATCVDDAVDAVYAQERWIYKSIVNVSRHFEVNHS